MHLYQGSAIRGSGAACHKGINKVFSISISISKQGCRITATHKLAVHPCSSILSFSHPMGVAALPFARYNRPSVHGCRVGEEHLSFIRRFW